MTLPTWVSVALGAAGAVAAFLALAGFSHTPAGRALWHRAAGGGTACPFGGKAALMSAEQLDAQMRSADTALRGPSVAGAMPALGFGLTSMRRDAFRSWADAAGARCHDRDAGLTLECAEVPFVSLSLGLDDSRGTIWARFDTTDRLREVTAVSRAKTSTQAVQQLHTLQGMLAKEVGEPHVQRGEPSVAYLERGQLVQSVTEYRFVDYYAKLAATNMGGAEGYSILQKYRALTR